MMKKLIYRLAEDFGLAITVQKYYLIEKKYVFINNASGSLMNDATIWDNQLKKLTVDFVNVAHDVSMFSDGRLSFNSIDYFDDYEKAKKQLTRILNKIKELKMKKKIELIEKDF